MTTPEAKMREEFEATDIARQLLKTRLSDDRRYESMETEFAYLGFQAGRSHPSSASAPEAANAMEILRELVEAKRHEKEAEDGYYGSGHERALARHEARAKLNAAWDRARASVAAGEGVPVRMLTDRERIAATDPLIFGTREYFEAIQRKFCAVNNLSLGGGDGN